MNVLCFSTVGLLHDFWPVAIRTDRICCDVSNESNLHKCGCSDTTAAKNSCKKKRKKKVLSKKWNDWRLSLSFSNLKPANIILWKLKWKTKNCYRRKDFTYYVMHTGWCRRGGTCTWLQNSSLFQNGTKKIISILVIVVNLSLFLQLRTSVHTDCNALTQQHPLITMWENSGRKKNILLLIIWGERKCSS